MRRWLLIVALAVCGCTETQPVANPPTNLPPSPPAPPSVPPLRVLAVTATAGFRHDSIPRARQVLQSLALQSAEFIITFTENLGDLTATQFAQVEIVMFLLTSGELPLSDAQKAALIGFVNGGGGFIGVHSATDTLYDWADYGRLVGAYFKEHPWTQDATVRVENATHASTRTLGASFRLMEEYYTFRENPRPNVQVLLSLDAASVSASGDFPLSWAHAFGNGRSFYSALGHFESTWNDIRFQQHMAGAIRWTGKRE